MKKFLAVFPLLFLCISAFPQKVNIHVTRYQDIEWQILDEGFYPAFPGSELIPGDSASFSLEVNKRYYLKVSILLTGTETTNLLLLYIDEEPVVLVNGDIGEGDHFLPFHTGIRRPETKITGGTDALLSEFPWQVYINAGGSACGGSIIAGNWILTAAHCVLDSAGNTLSPGRVFVTAGADNPFDPDEGQVYRASQVIPHENYNQSTLENDIALIRLQTSIQDPSPVRIVTSHEEDYGATDPGVMTWVTGWGTTSPDSYVFPTSLQKVQLPIITLAQASTVWRDIPSTVIMAGYRNGNKDACSGDSGGPMVVEVMGEYRLAGLVSWGSSDCDTYGAYTRVSLFENWIYSNTGIDAPYIPSAIRGDSVICSGTNNTQYSVTPASGIESFEWSLYPREAGSVSGTAATATISWNTNFTGKAELGYRIVRNGVLSEWSRLILNVVDRTRLLIIPADQVLCENRRLTFDAEVEGYQLSYTWYRNGTEFRTGINPDLVIFPAKPEHSGTYILEARGYCNVVRSGPINLIVNPLTQINSLSPGSTVPFGSDHTLTVNAVGHQLQYQWLKDDVPIPGESGSSLQLMNVDAADIGIYRVVVSGSCGIETSDSIYLFVNNEQQAGGTNVYVWPTITANNFNIATDSNIAYDVMIIDTSGKLQKIYRNLRYQNTLNIATLPKGLYIISVRGRGINKSVRIIKN